MVPISEVLRSGWHDDDRRAGGNVSETGKRRADVAVGVVVPMVTPVTRNGQLDEPAVRRVIVHLIDGGVHGIFVLGTTGEAASVPSDDRDRLVEILVEEARGRVATYAGIADNCVANSVVLGRRFLSTGVDAVVAHLPYYYALTPEEQYAHFVTLADAIDGPLMLYNIPSTTHMSISAEVVTRLAAHSHIIGLKDSDNSADRLRAVMDAVGGREDFCVLVGAAVLSSRGLALGATGMVPSSGNLVPRACRAVFDAAVRGDAAAAVAWQETIDAVAALYNRGRTLGGSLAALKAAMAGLSLCGPDVLPPLLPLGGKEADAVCRGWAALQVRIAAQEPAEAATR